MTLPARSAAQRKQDTLARLEHDVDAWVATADRGTGTPYLLPLSFLWNGETLLFSTVEASPTIRNLRATGKVRVSLGPTRDVIVIDGTAEVIPESEFDQEVADAFAVKAEFDPRKDSTPFAYFYVKPQRLQAWREENELAGRTLIRDGAWLC
jgi:nitroimidazol reductase NimA-like FMN-containing flavoprotein (pyridoxamine 5'-phosphate oxidase superfamily)